MAGIDYLTASIDIREKLSLSKENQKKLFDYFINIDGVEGSVIISTCNRTEIYLCCKEGLNINPLELMCRVMELDYSEYKEISYYYINEAAITHLFLLSCGAKSQIFGEDQIISQIKDSLDFARDSKSTNNVIEVLFRTAITCGKKIKTDIGINRGNTSIASIIGDRILNSKAKVKNIMIIGNGQMGRLVANDLIEKGYEVTITIRSYKNRQIEVPKGARGIDYEARYDEMDKFDCVISTTLSPNFTIEKDRLEKINGYPRLFFDLAVPRDIEKTIEDMDKVQLYDIDELSSECKEAKHDYSTQLLQMGMLVQKYKDDFEKWYKNSNTVKSGRAHSHFPLFIDLRGRNILVVGAGKIASRRINTLCNFDANVIVIAPKAEGEILRRAENGDITYFEREFDESDMRGIDIALAATDNREVNRLVGEIARRNNIPVSVADAKEECSFYFPALAIDETTVVGVAGNGTNHTHVAKTAKKIREVLKNEA